MKLRPHGNRLLVGSAEEKQESLIVVPETIKQDPPCQGKVLAVGDGKLREDGTVQRMPFGVGDVILFKKYSGTEIKVEQETYWIVNGDDVLGVFA